MMQAEGQHVTHGKYQHSGLTVVL